MSSFGAIESWLNAPMTEQERQDAQRRIMWCETAHGRKIVDMHCREALREQIALIQAELAAQDDITNIMSYVHLEAACLDMLAAVRSLHGHDIAICVEENAKQT